jgi:hypothetical protein
MAIIEQLKIGRVIVFDSMLFKNRWAFCIDKNLDEQIVYRGLFGLKAIDKKTFLGFARIIDIFNYAGRDLTDEEKVLLKKAHKTGVMKFCSDVEQYVDELFKLAGIKIFFNPEGWAYENIVEG